MKYWPALWCRADERVLWDVDRPATHKAVLNRRCLSDSPQRSAESFMVGVIQANEAETELRLSAFAAAIQELNQRPNVAGRGWNLDFSQRATPKVLRQQGATASHG